MIPQKTFLQKKINRGIELLKKKDLFNANKIFENLKKNNSTKIIGLFFLGIIKIQQNKIILAKKYFIQLLEISPHHEDANLNLALIFFREKKYDESIIYLDKVIKINNRNLSAIYQKGLIYFNLKNLNKAIDYFQICISLNKNHIYSYINLGHCFLRLKDFNKAINNYTKVLTIDPSNNSSKFNLSWCYFANLNFENAFKFYEYRKEKVLPGEKLKQIYTKIKSNEWLGENLDGKKILILGEQGIGDNIQFFRYLYWLYESYSVEIIFYTDKNISHLFENSPFKIITNLKNIDHIDFHILLLSLPKIYYNKIKTFYKKISYIKPQNELLIKWKTKLDKYKKPIIAINWQGDKNYAFDSSRSIPLSFFKEILEIDKFSFISLQKGFGVEQIKINNFEKKLVNLSSIIDNNDNAFEDTVAILTSVDCFITSDTALCHLASTLNVKTYLLLENNPDWRWFIEKKFKCFYPNIKIIQQDDPGNWCSVFSELKENLIKNFFSN